MRAAPASWRPSAGIDPDVLIKEARRRQRRRYVAAALSIAAVVAGAAGVLAGLHEPSSRHPSRSAPRNRPRPPAARHASAPSLILRSVDTALVMWPVGAASFGPQGGPPAYIDDLSTGRITLSQAPAIAAGDYQPLLTQVGHWLVYVGNGTDALRDDLSGTPRVLGSTPFFAPAARAGHVWLFQLPNSMRGAVRARLMSVTGGPPGPAITLPAGASLPIVRGTDAGLLLQVARGRLVALALWNPGSTPVSLPYSPGISDGFDASSRLVAYGTGCRSQVTAAGASHEANTGYETCPMLRVLNVATGKLISFAAPPGTAGWVPNGFDLVSAISPGDRMIAAYAAMRPQGQGRVRLYTVLLSRPSRGSRVVPSSSAYLFARTAWSAKGSWLLYQGRGGHLWAYQVTSGKVRTSGTPCCQYSVMVAAPADSG